MNVIEVNWYTDARVEICLYFLIDCCLDVDWLDDTTFASCSADMNIHIMKVNESKPIKTLTYVLVFYKLLVCLPNLLFTAATRMRLIKSNVIRHEPD